MGGRSPGAVTGRDAIAVAGLAARVRLADAARGGKAAAEAVVQGAEQIAASATARTHPRLSHAVGLWRAMPWALCWALQVALAVWVSPAQAQAPAAAPAAGQAVPQPPAESHAAPGIGVKKAAAPVVAVAVDTTRKAELDRIARNLACACEEGGDLHIDRDKPLTDASCACPYAQRMRKDLDDALGSLSTAQLADKRLVAETVESTFVPLAAEYERVFRFDQASYDWFMHNVRCVCDGCKPTVFFDKCQLTCTPAILYKLRVRVFLAMGFGKEEVLDYYLAEYNAGKPPREQVARDWLLPRKQTSRGWLVPAAVIGLAIAGLYLSVRRWRGQTLAEAAAPQPADQPPKQVAAAERERLQDAIDDLDD